MRIGKKGYIPINLKEFKMEIYSFIGSAFEEKPKKECRLVRICKKIWNNKPLTIGLLSTYVLITVLIFSPLIKREYKKSLKLMEEQKVLVDYAYQDFYSDEYKVVERPEYMIELFPYGETDNQEYQVEEGRIIKTTWYKMKKGKKIVAHEEYYLLDPKD